MLLNTKKLSFLGLLLAIDVILIILSGVLEFSTLFLLAAASFCVGVAIREAGIRFGFGFYLASILLSLILASNKLYCITYAAFGLYLVVIEFSYEKLIHIKNLNKRKKIFWLIKYITFNVMYLPMLIFFPKLIYQGDISAKIIFLLIIAGQAALLIYDKAYEYFQCFIWNKLRGRLKL